jgi:hypothetical protein
MTNDMAGPFYPLEKTAPLVEMLRKERGVRSVIPLSLSRVMLRSDLPRLERLANGFAIGMDSDFYNDYKTHVTMEQGNFLAPREEGILLPRNMVQEPRPGEKPIVAPGMRIFLDNPSSRDNLNLTGVVIRGSYGFGSEQDGAVLPPVYIVDAKSFTRSAWRSYGDFFAGPAPAASPAFPSTTLPLLVPQPKGDPLSYQFLFSLPTLGEDKGQPAAPFLAHYIFIILEPSQKASRAQFAQQLKNIISRNNGNEPRARLDNWDPPASKSFFPPRLSSFLIVIGLLFFAVIILANLMLKPDFPAALVEEIGAHPGKKFQIQRRVAKKSLLIGLTYGTVGIFWALVMILLYNHFSDHPTRKIIATLFGLQEGPVWPSLPGLLVSALMILLFFFLSTPVPRYRVKKLIRKLTAVETQEPMSGAEKGGKK